MKKDQIDSAIDELAADVEQAGVMLRTADSQFLRRVYVRALFAYLEGMAYWMRQNAVEIDKIALRKFGAIDWDRHILLYEEHPTINENGAIKKKRNKYPFKSRFAFTVRAFAEIVECKDDLFGQGWQHLLEAVKVRDRLVHPKKSSDVLVSDSDMALCREGYKWFATMMLTKFRKSADVMLQKENGP